MEPTGGATKEEAAKSVHTWLSHVPREDVVVYTDGSQDGPEIGYGYAVYKNNEVLAQGKGKLHPISVVFDAEVVGAWKGLQHAIDLTPRISGQRI